jgi:hypothetical protein
MIQVQTSFNKLPGEMKPDTSIDFLVYSHLKGDAIFFKYKLRK